jgi:DeoR/GlpR family transcriptional regulator of sugar metabolism
MAPVARPVRATGVETSGGQMAVDDVGRPGLSEVRRTRVAEMLQAAGAVTITDLQARFGVSPMTARRDLAILAQRGVARRTHGGAVLPSLAAGEHSFRHRVGIAPEAKSRLAEAAFALLAPGETLFLDASSTTYFLARLIAERGLAVRVITNSLPVLDELANAAEVEVVATGGTFRRLTCSYVGPGAVRAVRDHFADRLFMSITAVAPNGVMADADALEAEVKRVMIEQAEQSVLLLDDSKLSARGRQAIAPVRAVSLVLADRPGDAAARLRELGATVRAIKT